MELSTTSELDSSVVGVLTSESPVGVAVESAAGSELMAESLEVVVDELSNDDS